MNVKPILSLQRGLILALLIGGGVTMTAVADPASKATGELLAAKKVTLNGAPASAGLTVLSGSRIKTSLGGRVTVNLSSLGRVTIGPNTEMVLTFSDGQIGGELLSGWMVVSAPKGVKISPSTADGVIMADGAKSSLLTVDVTSGSTRVESSGANVLSGSKKEFVAAGEELEFSRANTDSEAVIARHPIAASAAAGAPAALGLTSLFGTGVRGAVEGITLNHSSAPTHPGDRPLDRTVNHDVTRLNSLHDSIITCGDFNENCANCSILPELVKAKPGCAIPFNVSFVNVTADSFVSVRPFFSNACFMITPTYPQVIHIPPGSAAPFLLDATLCPINAGKLPQNSEIVIETDTCGTATIQVEWAPPCF
jgi:hypothetical protein